MTASLTVLLWVTFFYLAFFVVMLGYLGFQKYGRKKTTGSSSMFGGTGGGGGCPGFTTSLPCCMN